MKTELVNSYDELSRKAKGFVFQEIEKKRNLLLCAATGSSPTGLYQNLAKEFQNKPEIFSDLRVLKLDEWGGIPLNDPESCETYLQKYLVQPLQISDKRYFGFDSNPKDAKMECNRIQQKLKKEGPIDVCILGIGSNGHLALNEPNHVLQTGCHVARLSDKSLQHSMIREKQTKPTYGLTLGMADIFQSKTILLLIDGAQKREIVQPFLSKKVTTELPASLLWLHPNVLCLINNETIKL